eukprot:8110441-Pyramimonas_sp.AAC.1
MSVDSFTALSSWSYLGLCATVHAQSMMRPFSWTPKSTFITLSYVSTVWSPPFGVQCAATQSKLHPVGNATPACAGTRRSAQAAERGLKKEKIEIQIQIYKATTCLAKGCCHQPLASKCLRWQRNKSTNAAAEFDSV